MVMMRFAEPERPMNASFLPHYDRPDYWHAMYRAVHVKSDDLVEINHFTGQRMRVVAFLLLFLTLIPVVFAPIYSYGGWKPFAEDVMDDFEYVFDFEGRIRTQYKERIARGTLEDRTEEEYVESFQNSPIHKNRFWGTLFPLFVIWSMPLLSIGIVLFWPQACPVRFYRKREVIYTWHKKKLYVADTGPQLSGLKDKLTSEADGSPIYDKDKSMGAYGIEMIPADGDGDPILVRVGPYPNCHGYQNKDVAMFVRAFMASYMRDAEGNRIEWNGDWLSKVQRGRFFALDPLRWLGSKTLGRKHRFDEATTEAALMDFLTAADTRLRGQPHWRRGIPGREDPGNK